MRLWISKVMEQEKKANITTRPSLCPTVVKGGEGGVTLIEMKQRHAAREHRNIREFRGQSCSAVLIVRNPRKAMFHPKSVSTGVTGLYCSVYYMGIGDYSICSENFEAKAVQLHSFPATPGKQCLRPKVSLGGLRDRTVEYTTWVLGITVFAQSFHYNREFRGQSGSAALIFRNPWKAMFAPKSVSRGVAGSYCWVYYMGIGDSVFAQSFHCNRKFEAKAGQLYSFPANPGKQCLRPKVSLGGLRDRAVE